VSLGGEVKVLEKTEENIDDTKVKVQKKDKTKETNKSRNKALDKDKVGEDGK
jgi:hypothetical protein